jgi:hypothetical protein
MKLSSALSTLVDATPQAKKVKTNLYFAETALAANHRLIKGRQVLWYMLQHFTTEEDLDGVYDMQDLMNTPWQGDSPEQIAHFRGKCDEIPMQCGQTIPPAALLQIIFRKMENSKIFAEDLAHFRRVGKGHEHHTLEYLNDCMDRFEVQHQQEKDRQTLRGAVTGKIGAGSDLMHAAYTPGPPASATITKKVSVSEPIASICTRR